MAHLVAISFRNETDAGEALKALREVEKLGEMELEDTAVLVKDQGGKLRVDNEASGAVETGAVAGGMVGLVLGVMFPVAGLAVGAAGGALIGRTLKTGVDGQFVKDLGRELEPGTSALFLMVRRASPEVAVQAVKRFKGSVYQTTLPPELEEELQQLLKD
jgi:uncharacterized membrane protein